MEKRILIIDDDADLATSLRDLITIEGYQVTIARNGKVGLDLQGKTPFDLVITDIVMPENDGLEVIISLRCNYPQTKVIAMSGGGYVNSRDYLLMAKELGASMALSKPFEFHLLQSEIRRLLANGGLE
ncbi:MAG: response regulator [Bacteroidales bacterium]|nr:response regulator [Bacteroidales bacterium]MBN2750729.1 response regulator [Bacteroidales bacterium]